MSHHLRLRLRHVLTKILIQTRLCYALRLSLGYTLFTTTSLQSAFELVYVSESSDEASPPLDTPRGRRPTQAETMLHLVESYLG